ncbi:dTMP kinase [Actinacidiphila paucisporea]|uniref:Thymidylate kinase n=1 Tax=Actinacidiphila paucisporea TaxID=310782 RepID=A0A1M7QKL9_9ACTN|nr:dTMP kinase [Actinacidiphila paucisporea]SHN31621.1 thymidylate kinase [Actinacidiphila paucisporea]
MTRSEQPPQPADVTPAFAGDLAADSRDRAVGALLKIPALRKLWNAQLTGAVADRLGLLVLLWLTAQATGAANAFGGGYRGVALATAAVFAVRLVATVLFGAVLLGPLSAATAEGGPLDRRWTMIGADAVRLALFIVAPLWITWSPDSAHLWLLATAFAAGIAERLWAVAKDGAAPMLLPPKGDTSVRPAPDHLATLHRLDLRTSFVALPLAAAAMVVVTLVNTLLATGINWFDLHQVALSSYVAAGLFSASLAVLSALELPSGTAARPRSPLEGLRLPKGPAGAENGRTGALPLLVPATAAVAGAIAAAVSVAVLHAAAMGFGPTGFGLLVLVLTAGTVLGIRVAPRVLPGLSRRRLLALAIGVTGVALLLTGLVPDPTTVLLLSLLAGTAAGVSANIGHLLIEQEAEETRRARTTEHLQAVARAALGVAAICAPLLAAAIGPHRIDNGRFTFDHAGAAYTLMLVGALLLPVAALVLGKTDDRSGVPLRRDLREALRGAEPSAAPAATGFFIAVEGGDGAGKSTQVEALASWIRAKGHEVVVTREPGATAVGKRLRSILLDVSSGGISHRTEALLYAADRAEHIDTVVRPALARGAVVISDRYIDSAVAYQGAGRDLAPTEIARINRWATDGLVAHLTVLLDVSPETARERFTEAPDRLESEPAEFHQRVRAGFLTLAAADPARYLVIDAGQDPAAVTTVIRHRLDEVLPLSAQEIEARAEADRKAAEEAARLAAEEAARKAEAERAERERQAQLEKLHREEEERRLAAEEAARQEIADRKAAQEAEAARLRQEEADRLAAEEAARVAAETAAREAEQARLRRLAEEQAKLRSEAEARRLEKQRKAEEALLRAEAARAAAAPAPAPAEVDDATTVITPAVPEDAPSTDTASPADATDTSETTTVLPPVVPAPEPESSDDAPEAGSDETAVLPAVPAPPAEPAADDETAVLPPVPGTASDADPVDRVPPWLFRPESGPAETERTRELPAVQPSATRRPRPDWAEETPLDDLPTLADELLGRHDEDDHPRH